MSSLVINNLRVEIEGKEILKGVSLTINTGEIRALMGPNGSGKSTLAYALIGHPAYKIKGRESAITLDGKSLLDLAPDKRARLGLLLAFQNPVTVAGVPVASFLRMALQQLPQKGPQPTMREFNKRLADKAVSLGLDESLLARSLNDGFSGGEKKKLEMLQILTLKPKFVIFDEIDTGLDIDALKLVSQGIQTLVDQGTGVLLITHYQRILHHLKPDDVHILIAGRIVESGGPELAKRVEEEGYQPN